MNRLQYFDQCEECHFWNGKCRSIALNALIVQELIDMQEQEECEFFEPEVII